MKLRARERLNHKTMIMWSYMTKILMFAKFNLEIEQTNTWDPPKQMNAYLEKHFNKSLKEEEAEAILEDYPMLNSPAIEVARRDKKVKKQLRSKGRDPHFGQEKMLFGIQGELLKVGGRLTCLWADMINPDVVEPDQEKIALLVQRALVLLRSASHSITLERRKIAWINPSLKSLAMNQYEGRKDDLFEQVPGKGYGSREPQEEKPS